MSAQVRRPIWKRPAALAGAVIPIIIAVVVAVLASITETPRLDASTDATLRTSVERMTARMSDAQKREFFADCVTLTLSNMAKSAFELAFLSDQMALVNGHRSFKPLGGMSAAEIHRKAEERRRSERNADSEASSSTAPELLPGVPSPFGTPADTKSARPD